MGKGSSGSSRPQEVTQTSSNIPEYARPFYEEMLGRTVFESQRPYDAYPGQRLQDFTPYEQAGMRGMAEMAGAGAPRQMGMAPGIWVRVMWLTNDCQVIPPGMLHQVIGRVT